MKLKQSIRLHVETNFYLIFKFKDIFALFLFCDKKISKLYTVFLQNIVLVVKLFKDKSSC